MGVPESMEPAQQIRFSFTIRQGPFGNRRDDRKGILNPMTELGCEYLLLLLGGDEAGNINKSQEHAIDGITGGLITEKARGIKIFSLRQGDPEAAQPCLRLPAGIVFMVW